MDGKEINLDYLIRRRDNLSSKISAMQAEREVVAQEIEKLRCHELNDPGGKKFKTMTEVSNYFAADKIQCLECGRFFKGLAVHIKTHGLSAADYKEKYGIPYSVGLTGEGTRIKRGLIMKDRMANMTSEERDEFKKRMNEGRTGKKPRKKPPAAISQDRENLKSKARESSKRLIDVNCDYCGVGMRREIRSVGKGRAVYCKTCSAEKRKLRTKKWMEENQYNKGMFRLVENQN